MSQSRNIKLTVAALLLFITVVVAGFVHRISLPRVMTETEMKINGLYLLETPRNFGEIALIDHKGSRLHGPAWRVVGVWCSLVLPTARISALLP